MGGLCLYLSISTFGLERPNILCLRVKTIVIRLAATAM